MNSGYTQANKKKTMAKKMGLTMHGHDTGYGSGMEYEGKGGKPLKMGGMKPKLHGVASGTKGQKPKLANSKAKFSNNFYSQTGHGK